jgi:spore maturation protein CgeB
VRIVVLCHSLVSDWNHGNAHFLRGVVTELVSRGNDVRVLEPADGWSRVNLVADHGGDALDGFRRAYPYLQSDTYTSDTIDADAVLAETDLTIVHEWTDHDLVAAIGRSHARRGEGVLLFHDSHHRSVTDPESMSAYDLSHYDGVLAFGDAIRDRYLANGWAVRAWTWHEAADTRVFYPKAAAPRSGPVKPCAHGGADADARVRMNDADSKAGGASGDVVWIGNWGDDERTAELEEFLFTPVKRLGLRATLFGVRYPAEAQARLAAEGIAYRGWLPNYLAPEVFARFAITVHVPRRPYLEALPGIPTIRPFEALACGIPLISARWDSAGGLFTPGEDFLVARDGDEMTTHMKRLLADQTLRIQLAQRGLQTIRARHTCAHRVDELLAIYGSLREEVALS